MDSTKNFFDAWLNTQSKIVDNLMDTSQKIKASMQDFKTGATADIIQNWADDQKAIFEDMMQSIQNKQTDESKISSFFESMMNSQMNFAKVLTDTFSQNNGEAQGSHLNKIQENLNNIYQQWITQFGKPLQEFQYMPGNLTQDSLMAFFDNQRLSMQMLELWQPIKNLFSQENPNAELFLKVFNWNQYFQLLQGLVPSQFSNQWDFFQNQKPFDFGNWSDTGNMFNGFFQQLNPTEMMSQSFSRFGEFSTQAFEQISRVFKPYVTMIPAGREKEMMVFGAEVRQKQFQYYLKGREMQILVFTAGQKSMEKVIRNLILKVLENSQLIQFDDFYNEWVNTTEKDFIEFFASETYSTLQGELLNLNGEIKSLFDKYLELAFAPLPVVPRSEMDELNKTVYELKKKVQQLEKQMATSEQKPQVTPKPKRTTPKKTTASKTKKTETVKA